MFIKQIACWFLAFSMLMPLALAKESMESLMSKGNEWIQKGEYKKAIENYEQALKLNEKNITVHLSLSLAYAQAKQFKKAVEHGKKAADLDPGYNSYYNLGLIYAADKKLEKAIEAFDQLWRQAAPWILAYTGFSGHGKSTLLDWLEARRCQPQQLPYALIGLGEYAAQIGDALHALLEAHSLNSHLPRKELELYRQQRQRALEERNRRQMVITQTQEMSGAAGGQQTMSANLVEALREFDRQTEQVIVEAWLECLTRLPSGRRLVFLLDNYDTFQETASLESLKSFWGAVERAHGRQPDLRVVLASRETLRHQNHLRVLQNGLADESLDPLTPADSEALLLALGVKDAAFREAVYTRLAHGHPLITRMAAEAWLETPGGIPGGKVPHLTHREEAVEWMQGRILDRLSGPLKQAVRWAALLRWFHADSLKHILEAALPADDFRALTRYAFIVHPRVAPDYWACHDLVRRVQMAYLRRERPDEFKDFHRRSQAYYAERKDLSEALYHHFFLNPDEAFTAWAELESRAAFAFDHPTWAALMEIGLAPEISLSTKQQAEINFRSGRRHYYRAEWQLADTHLQEALQLFRAVGDRLGEANVQIGRAHV